ncbi:MAG: hypothetical protein JST35_08295 [Armatimonadetes bacterium]|nr:hypothetical protein [Armatimonadota bacterium]
MGLPGFDGTVDTVMGSANVPSGFSIWEVSTRKDVVAKANEDFDKRSNEETELDRKQVSYVGVSLNRFPDRRTWVEAKQELSIWKDVRFLDLEDLSFWLDQYPILSYRMAPKLGSATSVRGLNEWWENWSTQCRPRVADDWMLAGREEAVHEIQRQVQIAQRSLVLSGSNQLDCLALLYSSIRALDPELSESILGRTLYVPTIEEFLNVNTVVRNAILVPMCNIDNHIVADPSNMVVYCGHPVLGRGTIEVNPPDAHALAKLIHRDCNDHETAWRAAKAARSSLSLLLRELGAHPIPFDLSGVSQSSLGIVHAILLSGRWCDSKDDLDAVCRISSTSIDDFSSVVASLCKGDPPLVRKASNVTFVTDQGLSYDQFSNEISATTLEAFKVQVAVVLGDMDPSFDLPTHRRWLAGVLATRPVYSGHLKSGFCNSLALISEHGKPIGGYASGQQFADEIVRSILENASERSWFSLAGVLPILAEASPDQFLAAVERDLKLEEPRTVSGLYFKEDHPLSGGSRHASLLWALERLAWSDALLLRVSQILCRLDEIGFGGNTGNNPMSSLREMFLPWSPSTNAGVDFRLTVLDVLRQDHPASAWKLQKLLMPEPHSISHPNSRPEYRSIASRPPVLLVDAEKFNRALLDRMLEDSLCDSARLSEVAVLFAGYSDEYLNRMLDQLQAAATQITSIAQRSDIWERMRLRWIQHTKFAKADWAMTLEQRNRYKKVLDLFEPLDLVARSSWLFAAWGDLPLQWSDDQPEQEESIRRQRQVESVGEIFGTLGVDGILELAEQAPESATVGRALADAQLLSELDELLLLRQTLAGAAPWRDGLGRGYVHRKAEQSGESWLAELLALPPEGGFVGEQRAILYLFSNGWGALRQSIVTEPLEVQDLFWAQIRDQISDKWSDECVEMWVTEHLQRGLILKLIDSLSISTRSDTSDRLGVHALAALEKLAIANDLSLAVPSGLSWRVSHLLDMISEHPGIDIRRVASLEFCFQSLLHYVRKPKALIQVIAEDPGAYCDLLRLAFKPDVGADDETRNATTARVANELLGVLSFEEWSISEKISIAALPDWIEAVVQWGQANGYMKAVTFGIGKVLAKSNVDDDGHWPAEVVCQIIERYRNLEELKGSIATSRFNMRGVITRLNGAGGDLERAEASAYRAWAAARANYPTVHQLLIGLASTFDREATLEDEREGLSQDL